MRTKPDGTACVPRVLPGQIGDRRSGDTRTCHRAVVSVLIDPVESSERKALDLAVQRLQRRFPAVPVAAIRDEVDRTHREYDRSRVRTYLPILVEREVAEHLARVPVAS